MKHAYNSDNYQTLHENILTFQVIEMYAAISAH